MLYARLHLFSLKCAAFASKKGEPQVYNHLISSYQFYISEISVMLARLASIFCVLGESNFGLGCIFLLAAEI